MKQNEIMAPSPRQPLSGQGVLRISGFKRNKGKPEKWLGVRLGTWNIGSISGRGTEVCEELRKREVDICCVQEVRWRGQGARFLGVKGRRYKLWWFGNDDKVGGVGVLVKEELCKNVVEVRRRSDRVMAMSFVFGEEVVRVICAYAPQSGRTDIEKERFYEELTHEWSMANANEMVLGLGDFNGHVGKYAEGFEGIHGGYGIGRRNAEGRMLLDFCDQKVLCVANTWYKKKEKRKVTYSSGGNDTEIDFVLVGKENRKYLRDVKVIPGELQHSLLVVDVEKSRLKKPAKKRRDVRRKLWKLKEKEIREKFVGRVEELVNIEATDLWAAYREGTLKACDEVCGKIKGRRDRGNTWWWNEEVKDAIKIKKKAFSEWCKNRSEENKDSYKKQKNRTKKVVATAMKKEAERELEGLCGKPNNVFRLVKFMKREGRDIDGGRCMKGKDGRLLFSEKERGRLWKDHMEEIMNVENIWDQMTEVDVVEGPVERVTQDEVVSAIKKMKLGKAAGPSEVSLEMITASGTIGIEVMLKFCQRILDGKGMPEEWKTSVVVPIFKGKGDVMDCGAYRGIKLLEHAMKIVERVLEKRIRILVKVDDMQFGFMPGKGTIDALFIVRRMQEEYREKNKKLYMCFVDLEKAFDRVPRRVMEWALRKKGLPEALVIAVMSLYEGSRTKVRVGSGLSEEFDVGVHQGSVLSPLIFAIVVDVVTENAREGLMNEILYADDLVLMSESLEELKEKFQKWKKAFESKGLKANLGKTKMMVCGSEGEKTKSKIDPCGVCGKRVMANSVMCTKCNEWIHGRCAKLKKVTISSARLFVCENCKNPSVGAEGSVEELCDKVETVKGFYYLGDRLNASGGCENAVTARTRIGWMKFRECGELLLGRRFSLKIKGMVYRSCVRSAMLYGSETWCLRENEAAIMRRTERAMVRAMCGVKLADRRNTIELMDMLGLKETVDKMVKANAVRWYGHVLRRENDNILRRAMVFKVNERRKRGRPKRTWKNQVEESVRRIGLKEEDAVNRTRWRVGVRAIAEGVRYIRPPSLTRTTPD